MGNLDRNESLQRQVERLINRSEFPFAEQAMDLKPIGQYFAFDNFGRRIGIVAAEDNLTTARWARNCILRDFWELQFDRTVRAMGFHVRCSGYLVVT